MAGDLRYVTEDDYISFGGKDSRKAAFSSTGWLGEELRQLDLTVNIDGNIFMHGGLNLKKISAGQEAAIKKVTLDSINRHARKLMNANDFENDLFWNDDSPLWYRGFGIEPEKAICGDVEAVVLNDKYIYPIATIRGVT